METPNVKTESSPDDRLKISDSVKEEKPLIKSSEEILTELFSSFNATPPKIADEDLIGGVKKHKKSKKKHKKKHKKKRRHGDKSSDTSSEDTKKRKKSKKKKKKSSSSDADSEDAVRRKKLHLIKNTVLDFKTMYLALSEDLKKEEANKVEDDVFLENVQVKQEKELTPPLKDNEDVNKNDKPKIQIMDLKNALIYQETNESEEKDLQNDNDLLSETSKNSKRKYSVEDLNLTESTDEEIERSEEVERSHKTKKRKHSRTHSDEKHHRKHRSREKTRKDSEENHGNRDKHQSSSHNHGYNRDKHTAKTWYTEESSHKSSHRSIKDRLGYGTKREHSYDRHSTSKKYHKSSDSYDRRYRTRSRSRSRSGSESRRFDKKKLLEIARKNAISMLKTGSLPGYVGLGPQAKEKVLAAIKAGGKSIDELTDFCKNLSREEAMGELSSVSSGDEALRTSDTEKPFNHPFQIKERPSSIIMNIPNSTVIPIKTPQEKAMDKSTLLMQFPVSSGQHHRKTENEWVPVVPKKVIEPPPPLPKIPKPVAKPIIPESIQKISVPTFIAPKPVVVKPQPQILPPESSVVISTSQVPTQQYSQAIPPVFPAPIESLDIGSIVSQRLTAMRKLQENPNDTQAIGEMYRAQKEMQNWATSKQTPGQFTGSTGAQILSAAELSSGYQAWARKDQLVTATPVSGGMGMHLLQKMGWRPGEGLGKEKNGALQPLMLEVKLDKKGLVADEEIKGKRPQPPKKIMPIKSLDGKHPVSLLGEYACKRKLGVPQYELCFECGPSHKKNFLFKVKINGMEYQPSVASPNKKQAKADAATVCLQQLGVLTS